MGIGSLFVVPFVFCLLFCDTGNGPPQQCPGQSSPPNGNAHCNGYNSGSTCSFTCLPGFRLSGSNSITCQGSQWNGGVPQCNRVQCPPFPDKPNDISYACSNGFNFESLCNFACETPGYSTCGDYNYCFGQQRICKADGSWSGAYPTCFDREAPTLQCPQSREVIADEGYTTALVQWEPPQITDNSGATIAAIIIEGLSQGSTFSEGSSYIKYQATDNAGNRAVCGFSVTIKVKRCPDLVPVNSQQVHCSRDTVWGSTCTFTCSAGYCLQGSAQLTCDASAGVDAGRTPGASGNGVQKRGATTKVNWNGLQPSCQRMTCPNVVLPAHGRFVDPSGCTNTYGSTCRVACDSGYEIVGTSLLQCTANEGDRCWEGNWDGQFSCASVTCTQPYLPHQVVITNPDVCDNTVKASGGTVCQYACNSGYILVGEDTLTCNAQGEWSHRFPRCQVVKCDSLKLPAPANGYKMGCTTPFVEYGIGCVQGCNSGYMPTEIQYVTCEDGGEGTGEWSATTLTCEAVKCDPPPTSENSHIVSCSVGYTQIQNQDTSQYHQVGSSCSFACDQGYVSLVGDSRRTCTRQGNWNGSPLSCYDNNTPLLNCPISRTYNAGRGKTFTDVNYEWEPVQAYDLGSTINATLAYIDNIPVTQTSSRFAEGDHILVYQAYDMAGNLASCSMTITVRVTRCYAVPLPTNGLTELVSGDGSCSDQSVYGSECVVRCKDGYNFPDNSPYMTQVCERYSPSHAVGYWSGQYQSCQANTCAVPQITNGYISGCSSNSVSFGQTCQFHCNFGYEDSDGRGRVVHRTCQQDGTWSGQELYCGAIQCLGFNTFNQGHIQPPICLSSTLPFESVCSFSCNNGYHLHGSSSSMCLGFGSWSGAQSPLCEDITSPVFDGVCPRTISEDTPRTQRTVIVVFDEPTATDNSRELPVVERNADDPGPGMIFEEGQTRVMYIAEDGSGNSARCDVIVNVRVRRCRTLSAPSSCAVSCSDGVIYGSTCTFNCNSGYAIQGSTSRTCEINSNGDGYWTGVQPQCTALSCPAIPIRADVIRLGCRPPPIPSGYGTTCYWYCPPGYNAVGSPRSQCQSDGTWDVDNFYCHETSCPAFVLPSTLDVYPTDCQTESSSAGNNCLVSCTQTGYRVYPSAADEVFCRSSGEWSQNPNGIQCEDFERPRFTTCPQSEVSYAQRDQLSAAIDWDVAADDNSGQTPSITCNMNKGDMRLEGNNYVVCTAMDAAGNEATCAFVVSVRVRRCQHLNPPQFGAFISNQCSNHYGSVCQVTCSSGYVLQGSSQMTCERDDATNTMNWEQVGEPPVCQYPTCSPLPNLIPGTQGGIYPSFCQSQTPAPSAGTICHLYCRNGFSLQNIAQPTLICQADGSWGVNVGMLSPFCQDDTRPQLRSCPGPQYITLDPTTMVAIGTFEIPIATDNSQEDLQVIKSPPDITSPYDFREDTQVTYTFYDSASNSVTCSFYVNVIVDMPPIVSTCPDDINVIGSRATVTWDTPVFLHPVTMTQVSSTCNIYPPAEFSRGSSTVRCVSNLPNNFMTSVCEFRVHVEPELCDPLDMPDNGALVCDSSYLGEFCYFFCSEDYDVPFRVANMFQSGEPLLCRNGSWVPPYPVPDCEVPANPSGLRLPVQFYYTSDQDCNDPAVQQSIKDAFRSLIEASVIFGMEFCRETGCSTTDIQVTCGPTESRRRRDLNFDQISEVMDAKSDPGYQKLMEHAHKKMQEWVDQGKIPKHHKSKHRMPLKEEMKSGKSINKRSTIGGFDLTVHVNLDMAFNPEPNTDVAEQLWTETDDCLDMMFEIYNEAINGNVVPSVQGMNVLSRLQDGFPMLWSSNNLTAVCPDGYAGKSGDSFMCSPCFPGTYAEDFKCHACPVGTYQDESAQTFCKPCSNGLSTLRIGSRDISQCTDACLPGQHSDTGLTPCENCPKGFYQPNYSAKQCLKCPAGQSTDQDGSQFIWNCKDICPTGSSSSTGVVPCIPCALHSYQSGLGRTECIPCPDGKVTVSPGSSDVSQCIDNTQCDSSPCQNGATCYKDRSAVTGPDYICACPPGYVGLRCHIDINECDSNPCANDGTCLNGPNLFVCRCPGGYEGDDCSIDINECISQPCLNNAACTNTKGSFSCTCKEGFVGELCQIDVNECSPGPCQNQGTCHDRFGYYECSCQKGWTGDNCEQDIDECVSNRCQHSGLCHNFNGGFLCACPTGYSGTFCEFDVDLCANDPCAEGATCVDVETNFECVCPPGRTGSKCEIHPCDSSPCERGACANEDISQVGIRSVNLAAYRCDCPPGYAGVRCEEDIDECSSSPCSNDGTCEDKTNGHQCICTERYEGPYCEIPINPCNFTPCGPGTCSQENDGYTCACPPGAAGDQCQIKVPICNRDTCSNGGKCLDIDIVASTDVLCDCPAGFTGSTCNVNINECSSGPCLSGGTCQDGVNSFTCTCVEGFTGNTCNINIDDCISVVCYNGGSCIDKINEFYCDCAPGFEGPLGLCEINISCLDNECVHGNCIQGVNNYECRCSDGYIGRYCNEDIDECLPNPCSNGGSCTDKVAGFECTCMAGWQGDVCDINTNECQSNPCQNGATCTDANRAYNCACPPGFTGPICSININDCASNPCLNFATCVDGINKFICRCPLGYKGKSCQINQGPCQPNPCGNGGECRVYANGGYSCACIEGYTGKNCDIGIDMCATNACQNGGTCEAQVDTYICHCLLGFSGKLCEASGADDVCVTFPCYNGGTCRSSNNDGAKTRCDCVIGYTGNRCEMNIDNCKPNPCLHGGICTDGLNMYTCQCAPGYSGRDCSDDVNECASHRCANGATCTDLVNGYACVCPHGFKGDLCQYAHDDFDFVIDSNKQSVELLNPFEYPINALTLTFWVKALDGLGNIFSYHQLDDDGNISTTDIEVFNPEDVTVRIKGFEFSSGVSINDNRWHHMTIIWDGQSGRTTMFLEGVLSGSGKSALLTGGIAGQGLLVISSNATGASFAGSLAQINMWDYVLTSITIQEISGQCGSSHPGNIVAPIDFNTTRTVLLGGSTIQRPSMCDDFADCQNNPCLNSGTCVDEIDSYTCLCPEGYEGGNCQTDIDDCVNHNCQVDNVVVCLDGLASYQCHCKPGFTGELCETRRVCDPLPIGDSPNLSTNCNGDGSIEDKVCNVACEEGYDISMSEITEFRCGLTTDYTWTQTNNLGFELSIPTCTASSPPTGIVVDVQMDYTKEVNCTSGPGNNDKTGVQLKISEEVGEKADTLPCVQRGACEVDSVDVKVCEDLTPRNGRSKRSTPDLSKPSIKIKLRRAISRQGNPKDQLESAERDLEEAVTTVFDLTEQGGFSVTVNNEEYAVDLGTWQLNGDFDCSEAGFVKSHKEPACVPCQPGSFWYNDMCRECFNGSYQPQSGKTYCLQCPFGTSPKGATDIAQCT